MGKFLTALVTGWEQCTWGERLQVVLLWTLLNVVADLISDLLW